MDRKSLKWHLVPLLLAITVTPLPAQPAAASQASASSQSDPQVVVVRPESLAATTISGEPGQAEGDGTYPLDELSFIPHEPYYTVWVRDDTQVELKDKPRLDCVGMPEYQDAYLPADQVPGARDVISGETAAAVEAFSNAKYEDAIELLKRSALGGSPAAEFALGCLMDGLARARFSGPLHLRRAPNAQRDAIERAIRVSRHIDPSKTALGWLRSAAEGGYKPAQWELARRWSKHRDLNYSPFVAIDWMRRLAWANDARAQAMLGAFYRRGFLIPVDANEAYRLLNQSALAGDRLGTTILADMLNSSETGRKDDRARFELLRQLAARGDAVAQYATGLALAKGEGVDRDETMAAQWLKKAADQKHADAIYELSRLLRDGGPSLRDETLAAILLAQAVERGSCLAILEDLEARQRAGAAETNAPDTQERLTELDRCDPPSFFLDVGPLRTRGTLPPRFRERLQSLERQYGRGGLDTERLLKQLTSLDAEVVREGVESLTTLARTVNSDGGRPGEGISRRDAAEALAILAFPATWLPQGAKEQMDSRYWRQRFDQLPISMKDAAAEFILSSRLTRQDMGALLALSRTGDGGAGQSREIEFLRRIGLEPAAFNALLARLDRGAPPGPIGVELAVMTHECSWTRAYSDWVSPMSRYASDCGGLTTLSSLSVSHLDRLAELGSGAGKLYLAMAYVEGRGIDSDTPRAVDLLHEIEPWSLARAVLGALYDDGRGITPDPRYAASQYSEALQGPAARSQIRWERGMSTVAARLGVLLFEGEGVPRDAQRGVELLQTGAEFGVTRAEVGFGDALILGLGTAQDREEGLRWYRQAAPENSLAFVRFGFLAATGRWNERMLGADRWYELAAQADDAMVYIELARAAAYARKPKAVEVRRWLSRAAAKDNRWASSWLGACPGKSVECFKSQPGFRRSFFAELGSAWPEVARPSIEPDEERSAAILTADVTRLRGLVAAAAGDSEPWNAIEPILNELESVQRVHGDTDGAIDTRLRRLLAADTILQSQYGNIGNYFAALDSSCNWGRASQMAYGLGKKEAAVLFAKVAVNRLQEARSYIADLDGDVRECFVDIHRDRYRWLASLLIESNHLTEAEDVLGMLKDFEHATYTEDRARRGSSGDRLALSSQETAAVDQIDAITAGSRGASNQSSALDAEFQLQLDRLVATVAALDVEAASLPTATRADWLRSVDRSIVVDLRRRFPPGTATLHAVVLPDRMYWLVSSREGRRSIVVNVSERDIDAAVVALRADILSRSPNVMTSARRLYKLIYEPVDRELVRQGAATVMLSLDGRLRYVPFAALHDGKGWLVERYSFSAFRRPDDYLRTTRGPPWTIAAFASTAGGYDGLVGLPGAGQEVADIVRTSDKDTGLIDGAELIDSAFTRESLADALSHDFRIVHIASHFVLDPSTADASYLLLGDGSHLPLLEFRGEGRFTFGNADLVTLSACQTALTGKLGDGSEIDSMAAIAQDAGAPTVVASLWSVADKSTADLMLLFYQFRAQEGMSVSEAMRRAQLVVLAEHRRASGGAIVWDGYSHPFYWAPFIVIGNWQ